MYDFEHYFEILDGSTQRFCGRTRAEAVSLVERLGLRTEGTLVGFAARKDTRGEVTPGSSTLDWIIFDGTKGYTLNTKSAARFTVQQSSDWRDALSASPVLPDVRVLGDGEKWKTTDSGTLESKECTKDRDGDNREVMLQEWITTMCSADYRASLPKPSGLKVLHRLATSHSKRYSDLIQCRVERLEGQLAEEAACEVNSSSQALETEPSSFEAATDEAEDAGSPGPSEIPLRLGGQGLPDLPEDWEEEPPPSYDAAMSR